MDKGFLRLLYRYLKQDLVGEKTCENQMSGYRPLGLFFYLYLDLLRKIKIKIW